MTYKDIFGWFPEESAATLERLMREHNVRTVLEIGSFLGRSTAFFAERCDHVTAIDPFVTDGWEDALTNGDTLRGGTDFIGTFRSNMLACGVEDKVEVIRKTSVSAYDSRMVGREFDLVYLDGAHDLENVSLDIRLWLPHATKIICGDDYDEHWPGVMEAVNKMWPDVTVEGRLWYKII